MDVKFSKLSTGNQIAGKIMEIRKGAVTAIVYVRHHRHAGKPRPLRGQDRRADHQPDRHHHWLRVARDRARRTPRLCLA